MEFKNISISGKCDVCGKEADVTVCCSVFGAFSYAYCEDCLKSGLEPYWAMVNYIANAGRFPDDINEVYQEVCRDILGKLGISEEQFAADVKKTIDDEYEYFVRLREQKDE